MMSKIRNSIQYSINRFLIIGILSFTIFYISAIYFLSQRQAVHEIEELFDAQLSHSSYILKNLLGESVSTIDQESDYLPVVYYGFDEQEIPSSNALFYQKKIAYQIYNLAGQLLISSGSAPNVRFSSEEVGYSDIRIKQDNWRVFTLYDEDWNFWLHVAESQSIREELATDIAKQTLWPGLAMLPFVLLLLTFIIRLALKPLKQLTVNIKKRDPKNLTAISLLQTPKEIRPVVDELNGLFIRLNDAISREQRLTADAAHELRTPLSVIMLHAQNAMAALNEEDRNNALKELETGVKRVSRLLEQLLTLSKVSPETIPVDGLVFYPLCQEVMAQMALSVMEKQQDIELICDEVTQSVKITGSHFLLEILLRNLIDNAREYSPQQGYIRLSLIKKDRYLEILIEDSGPGVKPEHYARLTDRFYREHQNKGKGAGLGLSLVKSIVDFHHGQIHFSQSSLGGLGIRVLLPINDQTQNPQSL